MFKNRTFKSVEIRNVKYLQMCHQRREILHRRKRKMVACGFSGNSFMRLIIAICDILRISKKKKKKTILKSF